MIKSAAATADSIDGARAMSRLADRLWAVTPPTPVLELTDAVPPPTLRPSPAVAAALDRTAALSIQAERRAQRPSRNGSLIGTTIRGFVAACSLIPYALVALALRLVAARVFFLDGQSKVTGMQVPMNLHDFGFSLVLPFQVKAETLTTFLTQYPALPVPPALAAYAVSYAEFLLPIMLVLGFGTRIAALGLLVITALIQLYLLPQALWSLHVYWASILMVLLALGPGQISLDQVFRLFSRR